MKKIILIFLMFALSAPAFAVSPFIETDIAQTSSSDVVVDNGEFFSKIGSGIKSIFGKVKTALSLSEEDIAARKKARAERKKQRDNAAANAVAEDLKMLNAAAAAADVFDNRVDAILESDEVTDPSAELNAAEKTYRAEIEKIIKDKSGKYVDAIKQDMDATINSARNLINKNAEALKKFSDNSISANRINLIDKAITGVSTAAMGLGGMQLAQGLGEQSADRDAAAQMQNYLSGIYCKYPGNQVSYGATGVRLTGANELDLLREDFATKAAKLKVLKQQLGIASGIESEIEIGNITYDTNGNIYSAQLAADDTGLYQNASANRGVDEFSTAQQRVDSGETSERITTGAVLAGGGAAVSVGGHLLLDVAAKNAQKQTIGTQPEMSNENKSE